MSPDGMGMLLGEEQPVVGKLFGGSLEVGKTSDSELEKIAF